MRARLVIAGAPVLAALIPAPADPSAATLTRVGRLLYRRLRRHDDHRTVEVVRGQ